MSMSSFYTNTINVSKPQSKNALKMHSDSIQKQGRPDFCNFATSQGAVTLSNAPTTMDPPTRIW